MAPSINGIAIPQSIREIGSYMYLPFEVSQQNGLGESITVGLPTVKWTFPLLYPADYGWWVTTLLAGAAYRKCAAVLVNDLDVEVTYQQVIVRRPTYTGRQNGLYRDVSVTIDNMLI